MCQLDDRNRDRSTFYCVHVVVFSGKNEDWSGNDIGLGFDNLLVCRVILEITLRTCQFCARLEFVYSQRILGDNIDLGILNHNLCPCFCNRHFTNTTAISCILSGKSTNQSQLQFPQWTSSCCEYRSTNNIPLLE